MIIRSVVELVGICSRYGIEHAILSPGSRCAPLTLTFARHPKIKTWTISDERSAAFIAMGMAQQLGKPVALVCTSGSAALNYYPAIAEAFFQEVPLLVLTADRPPEWIDQYDGQTIFQEEVYGKHVKASYSLPSLDNSDESLSKSREISQSAIQGATSFPPGPVHINVPLREPFYPEKEEGIEFDLEPIIQPKTESFEFQESTKTELLKNLDEYSRIIVVCGQQKPDPEIRNLLKMLGEKKGIVVITDAISNLQSDHSICFHDHWLGDDLYHEELKPDLIISFGKSVISKPLKLFLRSIEADEWHIQRAGKIRDPFLKNPKEINCNESEFFNWFFDHVYSQSQEFCSAWHRLNRKLKKELPDILKSQSFGEYTAFEKVLDALPKDSFLHVANSMSVRYLNFLSSDVNEIICNRGTSGIDGSNSTAVGCALVNEKLVTLITGDLAFFYDRNAFWHNYPLPNLRIIVLNNHAGGIFRLIKGPSDQPELEEYFETRQSLSAKNLAQEFNFEYFPVVDENDLGGALKNFFKPSEGPKLIEVFSESQKNAGTLSGVKATIAKRLKEV